MVLLHLVQKKYNQNNVADHTYHLLRTFVKVALIKLLSLINDVICIIEFTMTKNSSVFAQKGRPLLLRNYNILYSAIEIICGRGPKFSKSDKNFLKAYL